MGKGKIIKEGKGIPKAEKVKPEAVEGFVYLVKLYDPKLQKKSRWIKDGAGFPYEFYSVEEAYEALPRYEPYGLEYKIYIMNKDTMDYRRIE